MKDYTLSKIKSICTKQSVNGGCETCEIGTQDCIINACKPCNWYIEPSDMIELPCKIKVAYLDDVFAWQVLRRNKNGDVETVNDIFGTEADADAFLANLKGGKK